MILHITSITPCNVPQLFHNPPSKSQLNRLSTFISFSFRDNDTFCFNTRHETSANSNVINRDFNSLLIKNRAHDHRRSTLMSISRLPQMNSNEKQAQKCTAKLMQMRLVFSGCCCRFCYLGALSLKPAHHSIAIKSCVFLFHWGLLESNNKRETPTKFQREKINFW